MDSRPLNKNERSALEKIALLDGIMSNSSPIFKPRLQEMAPDGWRQYRIAQGCLSKAVDILYSTLTDKDIKKMCAFGASSKIYVDYNRAAVGKDYELVETDILNRLIMKACENECNMCVKSAAEIKACQLRKDLYSILPHEDTREKIFKVCPYAGEIHIW